MLKKDKEILKKNLKNLYVISAKGKFLQWCSVIDVRTGKPAPRNLATNFLNTLRDEECWCYDHGKVEPAKRVYNCAPGILRVLYLTDEQRNLLTTLYRNVRNELKAITNSRDDCDNPKMMLLDPVFKFIGINDSVYIERLEGNGLSYGLSLGFTVECSPIGMPIGRKNSISWITCDARYGQVEGTISANDPKLQFRLNSAIRNAAESYVNLMEEEEDSVPEIGASHDWRDYLK